MSGPASALYVGRVRHRRRAPTKHAFRYALSMAYFDLDELPTLFEGRLAWGYERRALASFRRQDHVGDPFFDLGDTVRGLVKRRLGRRPAGPIRLLTHPRYFGYCFNPVSFFYCFDEADDKLDAIVADVSNTPWKERHPYVLDAREAAAGGGSFLRFAFGKQFHVSPFFGMDHAYDWRFMPPGERLVVHMKNLRKGAPVFDATLDLRRRPLNGINLARTLARFPFMTGRVVAAIHWQALRLWLKRTPFFPHPKLGTSENS